MAIRKSMEERVCVEGNRSIWLEKVKNALEIAGFKNLSHDSTLFQIKGDYRKMTVYGDILVTLLPFGNNENQTELNIKSTANVDNIYALFKSPNKSIINALKSAL